MRAPHASRDGSVVAYEFEDGLWTVRPGGGEPTRLSIQVPADWQGQTTIKKNARRGASDLAIHPEGKLAAFVVAGDVFVTAIRSKDDQAIAPSPTRQITNSPAREQYLSWAPDGKTLAFTSDKSGQRDLYVARPAGEEADWLTSHDYAIEKLVATDAEEWGATYSPTGEELAYIRGKGQLVVRKLEGGEERVLFDSWNIGSYRWSPDGRFMAYTASDIEYNYDVFIVPAAGGEAYNVTRHPDDDTEPSWSADGRRLVWVSKRRQDSRDVYAVWLKREDGERDAEGWLAKFNGGDKPKKKAKADDDAEEGKKSKKSKKGKKDGDKKDADEDKGKDKKKLPTVEIDFDELWRRAEILTTLEGDEGSPLVVGDRYHVVFTAAHESERDLYAVRYDGEKLKRLTKGGKAPRAIQADKKGKTLYYLDRRGTIHRTSLKGKAGDPIPFSARYEHEKAAVRGQLFDEGWRALNERFYDPNFHGVDWKAVREKYRPWAIAAPTEQDFGDVMNLVTGELNASHMGYYDFTGSSERTGMLGVLFDASAGGPGLLVSEVLPESPAARTDVNLVAGERLLAVDGRKLSPEQNVYEFFADTVGRKVLLTIAGKDGKERRVNVAPISTRAHRQLRYEAWVRERRALVDELSGGRLGYIHIQSMSIPPFEVFERDLYAAAHGKEGLLIDVRANGGGWTTDYLMAVLNVKRHAYTVPRDGDPNARAYPQSRLPLSAWTKPAATLCDQDSYSTAEIFSRAFKNTGRGLTIGMPTFGAVISTGANVLLNGAYVRLPMRGWYDGRTGENQENNGYVPDIVVEQPITEDFSKSEDTQLARAVQELLGSLESDPRRNAW